jgi:hypothetical protein
MDAKNMGEITQRIACFFAMSATPKEIEEENKEVMGGGV